MAYRLFTTRTFDKDLKRCKKRGYPMAELRVVLNQLIENGCVDKKYRPHVLLGDRKGQWECHIKPDWILVWKQDDDELTLLMMNTGTHADLFG